MLVNKSEVVEAEGFRVHLEDDDIATVMRVLLIQKVELSQLTVWIKRQGTERVTWWMKMQKLLSKLLPYTFLRPSEPLDGAGLMQRELETLQQFQQRGFPVPPLIYSSRTAVVLGDVGPTIMERMDALKSSDPVEHDALLVKSAEALGELHAAGLCHGRPHVRDFFLKDGRVGFMDFEERPQEVMPLENAPLRAVEELSRLTRILGRFLPLARLIGRVRMGSDLRRFIMATDYLMNAVNPEAALKKTGKAGKDDRT